MVKNCDMASVSLDTLVTRLPEENRSKKDIDNREIWSNMLFFLMRATMLCPACCSRLFCK